MSLHRVTPLLESAPLSRAFGGPVWIKLDNTQPPGSFKIRGVGLLCERAAKNGARRFVSSSGGNAGLAAAYAGSCLGIPVTVVVPETTPPRMRAMIKDAGAEVSVRGAVWDEADVVARDLARSSGGAYVPPFDHPDIWEGNATIIEEVADEIEEPDAVFVAVGGGGLLCGVLQGLEDVGWNRCAVVAVETHGSASLKAAMEAGAPVAIDGIRSLAKSLGARTVAAEAHQWTRRRPVTPHQVSDGDAVRAVRAFLDDHRALVEPACGAALAAAYQRPDCLVEGASALVIVCGGAGVTLEQLAAWQAEVA